MSVTPPSLPTQRPASQRPAFQPGIAPKSRTTTTRPSTRAVDAPAGTLSLAELWQALRLYQIWMWGITCLVVLGALAYLVTTPPAYRAAMAFELEPTKAALLRPLQDFLDQSSQLSTQLEILRSSAMAEQVVKAHGLNLDLEPRRLPILSAIDQRFGTRLAARLLAWWPTDAWQKTAFDVTGTAQLNLRAQTQALPQAVSLRARVLASHAISVSGENFATDQRLSLGQSLKHAEWTLSLDAISAPIGTEFRLQLVPMPEAIRRFQHRLSAFERGRESDVIEVGLIGLDPSALKAQLNTLAEAYLSHSKSKAQRRASASLDFVTQRLPQLKAQLETQEASLNALKSQTASVAPRAELQMEIEQGAALQAQISDLRARQHALSSVVTNRHPALQSLNDKLRRLQQDLAQHEQNLASLPQSQEQVAQAERDLAVSQAVYAELLTAQQDWSIAEAGARADVSLLDAPMAWGPVAPKPFVVLLVAIVSGITLGVAAALIKAFWAGKITLPAAFEAILEAPSLATLPVSATQRRLMRKTWRERLIPSGLLKSRGRQTRLLIDHAPYDAASEAIRAARPSILATQHSRFIITGPSPGLGKSFVAANLACALAKAGKRCILVDADLRRGQLARYFGLDPHQGGLENLLADPLADSLAKVDGYLQTTHPGLRVLPRGTPTKTRNPDLLAAPACKQLFAKLAQDCDILLIDTAPVLATAEAQALAQCADAALLVVQPLQHTRGQLAEVRHRLESAGLPLAGFVTNGVTRKTFGQAYSDYGYGADYAAYR